MNVLTFDIEEWYLYGLYPKGGATYYMPIIDQYLGQILDLLDEKGYKATFFCLGVIARDYPDVIRRIQSRGHEIACHSDKHLLVGEMTPAAFQQDTRIAIDSLQQLTGEKVDKYRASTYSIDNRTSWAIDILLAEGVVCDSSISSAAAHIGQLNSFPISPLIIRSNGHYLMEFPSGHIPFLGKNVIYSGGGYFRFFPYWAIKKWMSENNYNNCYFHIRDFDKEQKRVISKRYFYSYYGVNGCFEKFRQLLQDFKFVSIEEAIRQTNWKKTPIVDIDLA